MSSKLVIVSSADKLSGTHFQFKYNFGDNLVQGNYDSCRLKFIDMNVETNGVTAVTDGLASMGTLFVSAQLGQDTYCNNNHAILGYTKYNLGMSTGGGNFYELKTPNPIIHNIPAIRGIVEFTILKENFAVLTGANVLSTKIIFQLEYFNKERLSEAVGESFFSRQ